MHLLRNSSKLSRNWCIDKRSGYYARDKSNYVALSIWVDLMTREEEAGEMAGFWLFELRCSISSQIALKQPGPNYVKKVLILRALLPEKAEQFGRKNL